MAQVASRNTNLVLLFPIGVAAAAILLANQLTALERLIATTAILYMAFKLAAVLIQSKPTRLLAYLPWPGLDPAPFQEPREVPASDGPRFGQGLTNLIVGSLALLVVAGLTPRLGIETATWLAVAAILFAIHLGFTDMVTALYQSMGWKVLPLFDSPLKSRSLSDFWTRRWNRPFVEMDRMFFLPPLTRRFGLRRAVLGVFLISGLLHEMAISYPAQGGWGLPTLYFALQAGLLMIERRFRIRGVVWTLLAVFLPLPLLFHAPFLEAFVWPLLTSLSGFLGSIQLSGAIGLLTLILAAAQILVLAASFQVPSRLGWREELPRLRPLNRKLMWTYGGFIVHTIVTWGVLTFALRGEIVGRTPVGLAISLAIFLFWAMRLAVDTFYFRSEDWPQGPFMQIGHAMLNALFTFIVGGYGILIAWNLGWI